MPFPTRRAVLAAAALPALAVLACTDREAVVGPRADRAPNAALSPSGGRWSDPASWPDGVVPGAGADVVVPDGRAVVLDVSPPALKSLTVAGTLAVLDSQDVALSAGWIMVGKGGRLTAGSEQRPFLHRLTVTLTGGDSGENVMGMGSKALGVMGGTLELHGAPRAGWTRLAATARAGAITLRLAANPGWTVGDRLVVASTEFMPTQAEEVTVTAVDGATVTISRPLQFLHYGERQTIGGRVLDERAEVGLLTRNVVVRGDSTSAATGYGGHVMVMRGGTAHVEGVEFYLMGQRGKQARYPFHWHLVGDAPGQYARRNSIWRSQNRCLTVHGTNRVLVAGNVCYDHPGHGYFVEDGAETGNTFDGNLGLGTRVPESGARLLPSDDEAATYWITNPANAFRNNVAAGSMGHGFWFAFPEHPTGPSADPAAWPRRTPLGEFSGNVAHSNRRPGLNVDNGPRADLTTEVVFYTPRAVPGAESPAVPAVFKNFTAYKHPGRAVWLRGSDHQMPGAVLADNGIGATFASVAAYLEDALVVGQSGNNTNPLGGPNPTRGFEFYDGRIVVRRTTFAHFRPEPGLPTAAISFNRANPFAISTRSFMSGARFIDAQQVYVDTPVPSKDGDRAAVFRDADGRLTGNRGGSVVADVPLLVTPGCRRRAAWNAYACPGRYAQFEVYADGDGALRVAPLDLVRDDGPAARMVGLGEGPRRVSASLPVGRGYAVRFAGGALTQPRLTVRELFAGDWVRLAVPYAGPAFAVVRDDAPARPLTAAASLSALETGTGDQYFYDPATRLVHVKALGTDARSEVTFRIDPR